MERPAAEIEPVALICSSKRILPGPRRVLEPSSSRKTTRGDAFCLADLGQDMTVAAHDGTKFPHPIIPTLPCPASIPAAGEP